MPNRAWKPNDPRLLIYGRSPGSMESSRVFTHVFRALDEFVWQLDATLYLSREWNRINAYSAVRNTVDALKDVIAVQNPIFGSCVWACGLVGTGRVSRARLLLAGENGYEVRKRQVHAATERAGHPNVHVFQVPYQTRTLQDFLQATLRPGCPVLLNGQKLEIDS